MRLENNNNSNNNSPSAINNFFGSLFSKDYLDFDSSHLQFRKQIIKSFQISMSIVMIFYIAVTFPFQTLSIYYYITLPSCLVLNYLICHLLLTKRFEKYCGHYIVLLQVTGPTVGVELLHSSLSLYNSQRALFMGIGVGLMYTIGYLNLSSPKNKFAASLIFFVQIAIRHYTPTFDKALSSLLSLAMLIIYVNFVYYRKEMLDLKVWNLQRRSVNILKNYEKLIEMFPNQLIIFNKSSLTITDTPLYRNNEADRLFEEVLHSPNCSFSEFLESFELDENNEVTMERRRSRSSNFQPDNLRQKIFNYVDSPSRMNEFLTATVRLRSKFTRIVSRVNISTNSVMGDDNKYYKWEVKLGWIDWCQNDAMIIIFNDISKTDKIRELKLLDQNKDRMLATISHELKTPLNGIIGMIDAAELEIFEHPENVNNYLSIAKKSARSLLYLINDIIDITQIRKGTLRLNFEKKYLSEIIEKVVPLIKVQLQKKCLDFIYENSCPPNTLLNVDSMRFAQILMNLLGNACKFTTQGFVKLTLKLKEQIKEELQTYIHTKNKSSTSVENMVSEKDDLIESSDDFDNDKKYQLEVSVEDSGIGISEERRDYIFRLFGKCDQFPNANEFNNGAGLGLAISQSLAKQMNSSGIEFDSIPGVGSRFYFSINVLENESIYPYSRKVPEENIQSKVLPLFDQIIEKNQIQGGNSSRKKKNLKRLLVVEDDQVNHLVIDFYLKAFKNKVLADKAFNGREAVTMILENAKENQYYDLIFMDCDMPVMNGLEATSEIRRIVARKEIPDVTIIAVTANASMTDKEICLKHGMNDVWAKPISRSEFSEKFQSIIIKLDEEKCY